MDLAKELTKLQNIGRTVLITVVNALETVPQRSEKVIQGIGYQRKNGNYKKLWSLNT